METNQPTDDKTSWFKKQFIEHKMRSIIIICILAIIMGVVLYYSTHINNAEKVFNQPEPEKEIKEEKHEPTEQEVLAQYVVDEYYDKNMVTIALLGFDTSDQRRTDDVWGDGFTGARADGIKLVSINFDTNEIDVINVPRDTYVPIADIDYKDKVNSAYYWGREKAYEANHSVTAEEQHKQGIEFQLETLSNLFVPIDYYVCVDFDFIIDFIDYLGGVKFECDHEIHNPNTGELMLEAKLYDPANGYGELNGTQAFIYMQDRKNIANGDFGRTENHTKLMLAIWDHIKENAMYLKAFQFMNDQGFDMIETNFSVDQMMALANLSLKINIEEVGNHTLISDGRMKDGLYYAAIDQDSRVQIIKDVFNIEVEPWAKDIFVDTTPAAPANFSACLDGESVALSWEKGDKYNFTFNVMRNGMLIASGLEETTFVDNAPQRGDNVYEVVAVNHDASSVQVSAIVTLGGIAAPRNMTAIVENGQVVVSWEHPQLGEVDFYVSRSGSDGSSMDFNPTRSNQLIDAGVTSGVTYNYIMIALAGERSNSASAQVTIP